MLWLGELPHEIQTNVKHWIKVLLFVPQVFWSNYSYPSVLSPFQVKFPVKWKRNAFDVAWSFILLL